MTPQEQEAFNKGRLQGLKEMDDTHHDGIDLSGNILRKLRQEYNSAK